MISRLWKWRYCVPKGLQLLGLVTLAFFAYELLTFIRMLVEDADVRRGVTISAANRFPLLGLKSTNYADYFGLQLAPERRIWTPTQFTAEFGAEGKALALNRTRFSILCWITTDRKRMPRAEAAKHTWGRDCDKFLIMADSYRDDSYTDDTISLPVDASYEKLWQRTQLAFRYLQNNVDLKAYDFMLKCDDDTFISLPNLQRFLLEDLTVATASVRFILGHPLQSTRQGTWMSGGAGYVLSQAAVASVCDSLSQLPQSFLDAQMAEDVALGLVAASGRIHFVAAVDAAGLLLLTPIPLEHLLLATEEAWYTELTEAVELSDGSRISGRCCSPKLISVHYVKRDEMHRIDFAFNRIMRNKFELS